MICAQLLGDNTLRAVDLSIGEECQYLQLVEQSQLTEFESVLSYSEFGLLFTAAVGLYALSFVVNMVLRQILNR
jgi:hypothetical protein